MENLRGRHRVERSKKCPNGIPSDKVLGKERIGSYQRRGISDPREVYRRSEKLLLEWIRELLVKRQMAFEAGDDELYGSANREEDMENRESDPSNGDNQNQNHSRRSAPATGRVKKPHRYWPGTVALREIR